VNTLYVVDGPLKGSSFTLNDGTTTIGRSPDSDVCISDIGASRHHAKFIKKDNRLFIMDVSSFQGVYVDGKRIVKDQEVEVGEQNILTIGSTVLSFQKGAARASAEYRGRRSDDRPRDHHSRSLELLLKVSNIFAQSIDIEKLLDELLDQVFSLLRRIDRGVILLVDKESGELHEVVSKTRMGDEPASFSEINYSRTIVKRTIQEREPVKMSNTSKVSRKELSDSIELMNIMSAMCVPIIYKGEAQGVIYVDSIGLPYGFRDEDLGLLTGLSNTAAIALQNARLYKELKGELSERKKAEEELKNTCQELQETRDMLVQSEKLAAIGRLTTGVAHEILNPVHIISMRLQLLEMKEGLSDELRHDFDICKNQLQRIIGIIEDLRQFPRSPEKHVTTNDLNSIIEHVLAIQLPLFKEEGVTMEVHYASDLPSVPFDKDRIVQVIFHIISNATEAMEGKQKKILRITTRRAISEEFVQVVVSDTGTGIDQDIMSKIFDPFFSTKDRAQGTGLGLYICYRIIKDHGGRIWAEDNEWGGASFFIELPMGSSPEGYYTRKGEPSNGEDLSGR
jgi:two-component system NtrC family sensor kinase